MLISGLKGSLSKIRYLTFLHPSAQEYSSDKLNQVDSDIHSKSELGANADSDKLTKNFNIKKLRISPKLLYIYLKLLLKRKITFSQFINQFKIGDFTAVSKANTIFYQSVDYTIDEFGDEFGKLFIDPDSEFNFFLRRNLYKRRMFPDDENIHFYRKPGSILHSEIMAKKYGTENTQLHYVMEFPGRFNNHYINSFSKLYAIRNLNYNNPQFGYFTFSKNAKLPTNFEEFLIFCSYTPAEISNLFSNTEDPNAITDPRLYRLHEMWSLFQYVVKYEYNMFNEYNVNDVRLINSIFEEQPTLIDNIKFWINKASTDAIDFNFFSRNFFLIHNDVSETDIELQGSENRDKNAQFNDTYDLVDRFNGEDPPFRVQSSSFFSFFYILNIYLVLFLFFVVISFIFCFLFLFFYSFFQYIFVFI